jgi:hypothetical protein
MSFMDEASALHLLARARNIIKQSRTFVRVAAVQSPVAQELDDQIVSIDNVISEYLKGQDPKILQMVNDALYGPSEDWRMYHQIRLARREAISREAFEIVQTITSNPNAEVIASVLARSRNLMKVAQENLLC